MARLHGDGFDHYGTTEGNMVDGVYAQVGGSLTTTYVATGTHSFVQNGNSGLTSFSGLRKVLPTAIDKLGAAARFYLPTIPTYHYLQCIFAFLSASPNRAQLSFYVDANGGIRVLRGNQTFGNTADGVTGGTLIAQTDPVVVAGAWNHIEVQAYIHDTLGWIRIAVNGVTVFEQTALDTAYDDTKVASVGQFRPYIDYNTGNLCYMDDYHIYDFNGDPNVDTDWCCAVDGGGVATEFIGELGAYILMPNADTAQADWSKSTGADGYALIDEEDPDDADYIYSDAAAELSEFDMDDLPEEITYIRGVDAYPRMSKNDAGAGTFQSGMKSVAATDDAAARVVTVEPTYWVDQFNVDPDSSARWTRTSLNAAKFRITRAS